MSIFGGDTGVTYEQLQARRKIAENLRQSMSSTPRNVGEGIHAIAKAISARAWDKQNQRDQDKLQSAFDTDFANVFGGGTPAPYGASTGGMDQYRNAIASIESAGSGDYGAVGPTHDRLGRALGRYQIMEANIGPWSREALGREVSADEFLANPQLQDAIFDHKFGGYVQQYGPEGAAQAWFAGPGGVGKMDRRDSLGTTVSDYTQKFSNALGNTGGAQPNSNMQRIAQLVAIANNPMAKPAQKAIVEALLQREMQAGDPMYQVQLQTAQAQLDRLQNPQPQQLPGAVQELEWRAQQAGLQPGTPEYQSFILNGGGDPATFRALDMQAQAAGLQPGTPEYQNFMATRGAGQQSYARGIGANQADIDTGGQAAQAVAEGTARGRFEGENEAQSIASAPEAIAKGQEVISLIDAISADPALPSITGMIQGRLPPMSQAGTDLFVKIENLQGKVFLEAFESLKGGGQITEREGQAAQNAMARLQRPQSDTAYREALAELRAIIQRGIERAQGRLGGQPAAPAAVGGAETPKPANDIPPAPEGFDPARWPDIWAAMSPEDRKLWE